MTTLIPGVAVEKDKGGNYKKISIDLRKNYDVEIMDLVDGIVSHIRMAAGDFIPADEVFKKLDSKHSIRKK